MSQRTAYYEQKQKEKIKKQTESDCLYPALNIVYKGVTKIRENGLRKIECPFGFFYTSMHRLTVRQTKGDGRKFRVKLM